MLNISPMKFFFKNIFPSLVCALLTINVCFGDNPIVQTNYTADPAPMVYNDTFNIFFEACRRLKPKIPLRLGAIQVPPPGGTRSASQKFLVTFFDKKVT